MRLFLDLVKADQTGDVRDGSYIKRVVTGTDKDGSPQYRYLRTKEEVDAWESGKSNKVDQKKQSKDSSLKEKLDKEQKKSKKKTQGGSAKRNLLLGKKGNKKKKAKKVKKSLFVSK